MGTLSEYYLNILVVVLFSFFFNCGGGGTGSEVGNQPFIRGMLFDACGNPAKNAKVTVRFSNYLAPVGAVPLGKRRNSSSRGAVCSTYTDGSGVYEFIHDNFDRGGVYCIEAWSEHKNSCVFIDSIRLETVDSPVWYMIDTPFITSDRTLRPPVSLSGTVFPVHDSTTTFVRVFGLDECVSVSGDGSFRLDSIPQGTYQLQIVTLEQGTSYDTVRAEAEQATATMPDTVVPSKYRVIYYGNGNTSGTAPVDGKWYDNGERPVVLENSNRMARAGYEFIGWNTRDDGSGTMHHAGDTLLKGDGRISLYAQWAEYRYSLTVISNGNGTVSGSDSVAHGVPHAITAVPGTGYNFTAWRVKSGIVEIVDSTAPATAASLKGGDAVVEAVFSRVITFKKMFDGILNQGSACVRQTSDGGYIMAGAKESNPDSDSSDVYLVKTDENGSILWTGTYGGSGDDEGYSVQQTDDGGYIIAGYTTSFGAGGRDVYLIRTDSHGDTLWTGVFGGAGEDVGRAVIELADGTFSFAGTSTSFGNGVDEAYFARVSENGLLMTAGTSDCGCSDWIRGYSTLQSFDGSVILLGSSGDGNGSSDVFLVKVENGLQHSMNNYTGPVFDMGYNVCQTADGGYIIVGNDGVPLQDGVPVTTTGTIFLIKTDGNGDTLWTKVYNDDFYSNGYTVVQTSDGGYLIGGGYRKELSDENRGILIKTTPTGDVSWRREINLTEESYAGAVYGMQQTTDGGFIIGAGSMYLIKTDALGRFR